jgi:hypothetical protein
LLLFGFLLLLFGFLLLLFGFLLLLFGFLLLLFGFLLLLMLPLILPFNLLLFLFELKLTLPCFILQAEMWRPIWRHTNPQVAQISQWQTLIQWFKMVRKFLVLWSSGYNNMQCCRCCT